MMASSSPTQVAWPHAFRHMHQMSGARVSRRLRSKESLHAWHETGPAWRVLSGALRLERTDASGSYFAGLALPGDLVGAEVLALDRYAYSAQALTPCELLPWPHLGTEPSPESLMGALVSGQQRMADLLRLRQGSAGARVGGLILMLAGQGDADVVLPTLGGMAEITDLAMESVCREMARFRQSGALKPKTWRHQFVLCKDTLRAQLGNTATRDLNAPQDPTVPMCPPLMMAVQAQALDA